MKDFSKTIDKKHLAVIQRVSERIIDGYRETYKEEPPLRADIFKLLQEKGRVLFYPLEDEPELDGFHVNRYIGDEQVSFVYINSAKRVEKNVFCAAHELGHIYEIEKIIEQEYPEHQFDEDEADDIMNRFAAELLMPEALFLEKTNEIANKLLGREKKLLLKDVVLLIAVLMNHFYVPYKAVVTRLYETGFLKSDGRMLLLKLEAEHPEIINKIASQGKEAWLGQITNLKQMKGLDEHLSFAEQHGLLSEERIRELREEFEITASDVEKKLSLSDVFLRREEVN